MIENAGNENWQSCEENQGKGGSERYAVLIIFVVFVERRDRN